MVSLICRHRWNALASVLFLIACVPGIQAQDGAITLPLNLAQLTTRAALVVHARVTYAHVEPHPQYHNLASVIVTLSVLDVLKGTAGKQITFRQFIWSPRDIADRAGYREGDELVLFLNRVTAAGFTSPVGLQQGRFRVVAAGGEPNVVVTTASPILFEGLSKWNANLSARARQLIAQPPGRVPFSVLKELVHALQGGTNR